MVPEGFRKSDAHRKLWATTLFLSERDPAGPLGGGDRDVAKRATDRRRTVLEHRAADALRDYFREEREQVVQAVGDGEWVISRDGDEDPVLMDFPILDDMGPHFLEVYEDVWGRAARDWGAWVDGHLGVAVRKYRDDQPRDERGRFAEIAEQAERWVRELGATWNGVWHDVDRSHPGWATFTEPTTHSSGIVSLRDATREAIAAELADIRRRFGVEKAEDPVDRWLRENAGKRIAGINERSRKKIAAQIAEGVAAGETLPQIVRRIDRFYLADIIPNRSMVIARTEVGHAANWAQDEAARRAAGLGARMEKEWASLRDDRVREDHRDADGQRVPLDKPFEVGDDLLMFPGDESLGAGPEQVIQCRCTVLHHVVPGE